MNDESGSPASETPAEEKGPASWKPRVLKIEVMPNIDIPSASDDQLVSEGVRADTFLETLRELIADTEEYLKRIQVEKEQRVEDERRQLQEDEERIKARKKRLETLSPRKRETE
ncbi:hypothetical protein A2856_02835 [Candidatus Uhrbacteria bacterium RIFCSPHIGHO2_01_FULL_63_20]|uniref:Uncharacterized protein n=1 Tax=Candidatus Uhrbacteria bacterium RIFCSPHIGHO2_01_FULL_63_20 TaxID=1802385 RepID=A0A1F7TKV0_9BACT|nr:MAG: hypothetical protein A2856_02835 [Candidatus Uhrbacteria bacterium RIFCSPHIGHO2_01_FULL_63_20]